MDDIALLDHGRKILQEVVVNMARDESEQERKLKSEGQSQDASMAASAPSRIHGRQRERQGFEIGQMVAEYRALRATVLRLWQSPDNRLEVAAIQDVIRFNEAIDQTLAESVEVFSVEVERARDVFLGMLGHDLRGPLSTIASCANLEVAKWPSDSRLATRATGVAQCRADEGTSRRPHGVH